MACDQILVFEVAQSHQSCQKSRHSSFSYSKSTNSFPNIWDTFATKFVARNFSKIEATIYLFRFYVANYVGHNQCDQIGRFIRLWATF